MKIDIVTLFPEMVEPALGASMLGRARQRGLVDIRVANLRDYAEGKHRVTDDYPFGGGGGMILKPEPLFAAVEALRTPDARVILMDPRGRLFTQAVAEELRGARVPAVLLSGDHARIARWRRTQALYRTWRARPELLERAALAAEERELVERFKRGDMPE